jgi:hypothetical protein
MKNLSVAFIALLSLAALGCGKKAAGPDCATAVNHSMDLSKDTMKSMGTDDAMMKKMVDIGVQHCKDDKWSADTVKCMIDAKTMADSQACYGKLTPEQQDKMNKAAMALATPPGSDPAASGSAATGGEATGSGAMGSGAADMGSGAAGSAATGGDMGSGAAAGSGAGSAAAPK